MTKLTLDEAEAIVGAAISRGGELGLKPLAVTVLGAGGNLKAYAEQDGSTPYRFEIASGKARASLFTAKSSRVLHDQAGERPHFLTALSASVPGGLVPVPGGIAILDGDGEVIGAVGVTGDTSDNDEKCAVAGIEAAGLKSGL